MRNLSSLCFIAAVSLTPLPAQSTSGTPIENESVKVLDVMVQPGTKTRMHDHKVNRVMVYLDEGKQHFEWQDGKPADLSGKRVNRCGALPQACM